MKGTERDIAIMLKTFDNKYKQIHFAMEIYRKELCSTVRCHDFDVKRDAEFFSDLGLESVLYKLQKICAEEINIKDLMRDVTNILDKSDE